jgi:peptide/nickel transport system ATP-binding protein
MTAPLVEIAGLTVDFEKDGRVSRAVDRVDFAIAPGEALGIVGESGSGKSVTWLAAPAARCASTVASSWARRGGCSRGCAASASP